MWWCVQGVCKTGKTDLGSGDRCSSLERAQLGARRHTATGSKQPAPTCCYQPFKFHATTTTNKRSSTGSTMTSAIYPSPSATAAVPPAPFTAWSLQAHAQLLSISSRSNHLRQQAFCATTRHTRAQHNTGSTCQVRAHTAAGAGAAGLIPPFERRLCFMRPEWGTGRYRGKPNDEPHRQATLMRTSTSSYTYTHISIHIIQAPEPVAARPFGWLRLPWRASANDRPPAVSARPPAHVQQPHPSFLPTTQNEGRRQRYVRM